ncbi:hypothetical protein AAVH_16408 [Aphelenchoides avenae]|nr:hypothetical protein AAVH_16408 [Aphelenchus avenae]
MDALQLVNLALDALLTAHFDDHPLRRLELTASGHRVYVTDLTHGVSKTKEIIFSGEGLVDESAARCLKQCLTLSFVSKLTLFGVLTHNLIEILLPVKDHFRNAICVVPLACANDSVTERTYNELVACKKILVGLRCESVPHWTLHTDFFRFRCWELCNELHFVHPTNYSVDSLIEWLSTGTGREFTAEVEAEERILELVEKLIHATTTASSYRLNFTYYAWNEEPRVKPSVRSNDDTHERLEVEVQQNGSQVEVTVQRYRLE